ncbi:MAG TPA: hypothetical protein VFB45_27085 [Pseudolabrys sp.]|nr:hypothetical protein [Pseudolabrys sp.]
MALTDIQKKVLKLLAANRSEKSYVAGGVVLNRDWPRRSDDIDIFHDVDEDVADAAKTDIATLQGAGYDVNIDVFTYGCVDATVANSTGATVIQWMGDTKVRFFPLVRDDDWGARLHQADLAVNKVLAASSRSKVRDIADLVAITVHYCPLGPLVLAAAGKPPNYSPKRMIDEMRRHVGAIQAEEYLAIKGLPSEWSPAFVRDEALSQIHLAEKYALAAPTEVVGMLTLNDASTPIEVTAASLKNAIVRKATAEIDVVPALLEFDIGRWDI